MIATLSFSRMLFSSLSSRTVIDSLAAIGYKPQRKFNQSLDSYQGQKESVKAIGFGSSLLRNAKMSQVREDLRVFFHPRTVAIIGASDNPHKPGWHLFQKIRAKVEREGGRVIPVNPTLAAVDGLATVARIGDIPEALDLAVIMVGDVVAALQECAQKAPKFVVIFTAGFAEVGEQGAALQDEVARIGRQAGIRLLGPNTNVNAFEEFKDLPGKKIALITQSGHQGRPIVQGEALGIGFSYWVPTGNEVDLEACDFIEYFADDESTAVIAAYIEGFKDGERLRRAADYALRRRKPIVLIKVGRHEAGARMALAHTGHLAGSDAVHDALFRQYGIVRVGDLDELLETAALFARLPRPRGDGVCIYGISGGTGALMADLCGAAGLRLPSLAAETQRALRAYIPAYLTVSNPVDNGASTIAAGHGPKILDRLLDDPNTALLACPIAGALPPLSDTLAQELADGWRSGRKAMVAIWGSPKLDEKAFRILVESGMPVFRSFRNAAAAIKAYFEYHRFADDYESPLDRPRLKRVPKLPAVVGALSEHESKRVLADWRISITQETLCRSADAAAEAARAIGFPVALKISSRDIPHKSEGGLVRLGIRSEHEARSIFSALMTRAQQRHSGAHIEGVLVQEMLSSGVETLVGVSRDPTFGPTVAFGLGGMFVEVMRDVAMRTIPLTRRDAEVMIREVRAFPLLDGARGRAKADVAALVDTICRVADFATACGEGLVELDINPLMVLPEGKGVKAVDALVVLRKVK
jgi:acetate---CoA ligase (ADP-forming)